jgi:hypothetical protein
MSRTPDDFLQKTIEEKSKIIHSMTDDEVWNSIPNSSFIFYYTKKDGEGIIKESYTLNKNFKGIKGHIKMIEKWYGFIEWDNILGSRKIVDHIKSL